MTLDLAMDDLLLAIQEALGGPLDNWRVAAVASALGRVRRGDDDPGVAADWLREFLAQRETTQP